MYMQIVNYDLAFLYERSSLNHIGLQKDHLEAKERNLNLGKGDNEYDFPRHKDI